MNEMSEAKASNVALRGANEIDAKAAEWVAKLDRHELDAPDRAVLESWLAEDPRNKGAFLRAQAAWKNLDRLGILRSGVARGPSGLIERLSRRSVLQGVAAGGAGIAVTAAATIRLLRSGQNQIETPVGEIRRVPLLDGSVVAVNTDTQLDIDIKPGLREMTLAKGEVWFDVAKDKRRPFVVASGGIRVRAIGTAFSVRRRDDGADVLVTEGIVETWTVGNEAEARQVVAGSRVFVSDIAGPSRVVAASQQIDRALAWREGEIALDGETLAEAAAEFNRYNERKLTIDPALFDARLVGWFHTNEPENFAAAAATVLKLKVTQNADEIHLSPDPGPGE